MTDAGPAKLINLDEQIDVLVARAARLEPWSGIIDVEPGSTIGYSEGDDYRIVVLASTTEQVDVSRVVSERTFRARTT